MIFNSISYVIFLPIVLLIYWSFKQHKRAQNFILLISSYIFYACWDYRFLSLILISTITDYFVGLKLSKTTNQKRRKYWLGLSLFINLGILISFKYFAFFIESFSYLLEQVGLSANVYSLQIILPVGISFYTFQTLSYTIDIYRNKQQATPDFLTFSTFVAFFPQLVAGPIERASNIIPQFQSKRSINYTQAVDAFRQILWGTFKKVVIADNCAIFVDQIYIQHDTLSGGLLWLGALLFTVQIYCDFSGYSDIAIGSAKLFGIHLMQNFSTPYFSKNIKEFWRRWHISLSTWFRDYVFIPLGGSRGTQIFQIRNIFVTFLLSGLWHGANWTFIFWGFLHACLYTISLWLPSLSTFEKGKYNLSSKSISIIQSFAFFVLIVISWIFFRATSIQEGFSYFIGLFQFPSSIDTKLSIAKNFTQQLNLGLVIILSMAMFWVEWFNKELSHGLERMSTYPVLRYLIYLILSLLIMEYFIGDKPFIYFQF